jgi:multidrug efflux pump
MNIAEPFIRRPIATTLLMISVLLAGIVAYSRMPVSALPDVDFPTIEISAALPGANAETMASSVASPLERALSDIPDVTSMTSSSTQNTTTIVVQFDLGRNIDAAAQDVQAAINSASGQLPKDLPNPPTYFKVNPAEYAILSLAVTSTTLPLRELDDLTDSYLAKEISRMPGVGLVDYHGEQKPAVRVQVNPRAIASLGIDLEDIRTTLSRSTVNMPKGTLNGKDKAVSLDSNDQLLKASDYDPVVVGYRNGSVIRIHDIGRVVDSVEDIRNAGWAGKDRTIIVDVHKQPGVNVAETVDRIKRELPKLTASFPPSVKVQVISDRTQTIRASVTDIQFTLLLTVALVALTIFLFLRRIETTVIPCVAVPVSLIGTFVVMSACKFSLNNVSLMGLTIAVGLVVDDAIVVMENIVRHLEAGKNPFQAALVGAREVGFTIVSMTISLIAVFIPLLLMGGLVGRLFREFSVSLSAAVIISGVVSLTLTPMMCARSLKVHTRRNSRFYEITESGFEWVLDLYARTLKSVFRYRSIMLVTTLVMIGASAYLFYVIPKGFFPQQDAGLISVSTEAAPDISFDAMTAKQLKLVDLVMQEPDVANTYSWVESGNAQNNGRIMINLKPFGQRKSSAEQVMDRLRPKLSSVVGISCFMQPRQDIQVGGISSKSQFQYTLEEANIDELDQWADVFLKKLRSLPQLRDVASDLEAASPSIVLDVDRTKASTYGIDAELIDQTLYDAFGQRQVANLFTQSNQYHLILEVDPTFQLDERALDSIYLRSPAFNKSVPLSAFVKLDTRMTPLTIHHLGMFPAVTLSFNLAPGVALGQAVTAINQVETALNKPNSLQTAFQGSVQAFQESLGSEPILLAASIVVLYIVLGILYESYIHPLTVLSSLPSATLGALSALMLSGYELSVMSIIGIILLIGIAKKNAIMMVDVAIHGQRHARLDPEEAIFRACIQRFRPIMMTTMAALLGALPLAFAAGAGSELRRPLGITIAGGLVVSQLLTLFSVPVIYLYFDRFSRIRPRGQGGTASPLPHAHDRPQTPATVRS